MEIAILSNVLQSLYQLNENVDWSCLEYNWVHFGDDYNYLTFNEFIKAKAKQPTGFSFGINHLGFEIKDVESIKESLLKAGYKQSSDGENHPHRKRVYFKDPNEMEVELIEYSSNNPKE